MKNEVFNFKDGAKANKIFSRVINHKKLFFLDVFLITAIFVFARGFS